ncbi:MAG: DUF4422 domain-containing protein [Mesosutterella sp.]|nr:DUF4422 domain-containing protein [Mesosutterella sp.]
MTSKLKILVGYHKPAYLLKGDIFVPIHLGRACSSVYSKDGNLSQEDSSWLLGNTIGDDTGENISHLNREFCELTGIYWAWKNYEILGNPEYIGFMHYRRQLIFSESYINGKTPDYCNMIGIPYPVKNYEKLIGLESIIDKIDENKIFISSNTHEISPLKYHLDLPLVDNNMLLGALNRVYKDYPEDKNSILNYINGKTHYWSNVFVLSKSNFFDLCSWIFPKLLDLYKNIDYSKASVAEHRFLGYLAEMLFGVFFENKKISGVDVISKPLSFLESTDIKREVKPKFPSVNNAICFATDSKYAKYLSVSLSSLARNSDPRSFYDILILGKSISADDKRKLSQIQGIYPNVSVRFINVKPYLENKTEILKFGNNYHYSEGIYYRYLIPEIFSSYKNVLYLDCDTIILDDVNNILNLDLNDYPIAAVKDIERRRWLKSPKSSKWTLEFDQSIGISDSYNYFNSGVCVFNVPKLIEMNISQDLFSKTAIYNGNKDHWYGDQDILNSIFFGKVKFLDFSWNVMIVLLNKVNDFNIELDANSLKEFSASLASPKILHYCDSEKPWKSDNCKMSDIWWKYAENSPYYLELLKEFFGKNSSPLTKDFNTTNKLGKVTVDQLKIYPPGRLLHAFVKSFAASIRKKIRKIRGKHN